VEEPPESLVWLLALGSERVLSLGEDFWLMRWMAPRPTAVGRLCPGQLALALARLDLIGHR
jgi:hypothetical protein